MFSPTSGAKTISAPKTSDLTDNLTKLIDTALVTKTKAEYEAGRGSGIGAVAKHRIGAGYIGMECGRALAYKYFKTPKEERVSAVSPGELQRHAEAGHWTELKTALWLEWAGFEIHTEREDGSQYGYMACPNEDGQSRIAGEIDGLIASGPEGALPYPCIWESKKATDKKFTKFAKEGVKKADPKYYGQLQTNMLYLEVENTLFSMLNLDTMKYYFEIVPFDPATAQRLQDRAAKVLASNGPEEMPRISNDPCDHRCRYCDFHDRCHGIAEPAPVSNVDKPSWLGSLAAKPQPPSFETFKSNNPF